MLRETKPVHAMGVEGQGYPHMFGMWDMGKETICWGFEAEGIQKPFVLGHAAEKNITHIFCVSLLRETKSIYIWGWKAEC